MDLSARQILDQPLAEARAFFPGPKNDVKSAFRRLVARWHPDVCSDPLADAVIEHLVALRDRALSGMMPRASRRPLVEMVLADGQHIAIRPLRHHAVDAGTLYVLENSLTWVHDADLADMAERELAMPSKFRFADARMEKEIRRSLSVDVRRKDLADGRVMIIHPRRGSEILLLDLLASYPDGRMPAEHVAWIGSRLMNLACWLSWSGQAHLAIGPDTILVDPETHSVRLVGGWGFSASFGGRPDLVPARTLDLVPSLAAAGKILDQGIDLELVRRTLCECLGDPSGTALLRGGAPKALADWLTLPPAQTAHADFKAWGQALTKVWGRRRFVVMDRDARTIYGS